MDTLENKWVGYYDRSYQQIKASVLTRLGTSNPEITDHSEGNILVLLISIFAGIAEMLGLYVDRAARESFLTTARRFSSLVKMANMLDYRVSTYSAASVDLTIQFTFTPPTTATTGNGSIPAGTEFTTNNGLKFRLLTDVFVPAGSTYVNVPVSQVTVETNINLGNTNGSDFQTFVVPGNYVQGSMSITIDSEPWTLQETLGYSSPTSRHFIIDVDEDKNIYVKFGNGQNGKKPASGHPVLATYYVTSGSLGNQVNPGTIVNLVGSLSVPGVVAYTISNTNAPSGGSDLETVEELRGNIPISIRTLDRAVTKRDYEELAKLVPGVMAGAVDFCCDNGAKIQLYIVPSGGGLASSTLLAETFNWFCNRKMVGKRLEVLSAGETKILVTVDVVKTYRANEAELVQAVKSNIVAIYGQSVSKINPTIYLSKILAATLSVGTVESATIRDLYPRPYARPLSGSPELSWNMDPLNVEEETTWRIVYMGGVYFQLLRGDVFVDTVEYNALYTDPTNHIRFVILSTAYTEGNQWEFTTRPANTDIVIDDNTIAYINELGVNVNIVAEVGVDNCNTTC